MEPLIKRRSTAKGSITRIETWLDTNIQNEENIYQFERRLDSLKSAFATYCKIQEQIESLDADQESDRFVMEDKYCSLSARFDSHINELSVARQTAMLPPIVIQQAPAVSSQINKPRLNISQFSGSLIEWESFYQLFEALIEKDTQLSDVEKLVYLRSYLIGEPLNLISNLKIIDTNFQVALNTLKERYANQLNIIYAHIRSLLTIHPIVKCNASNLRTFITSIKQNCDGLKNLQVEVDRWDLILVFILSEKLDSGTRKAFDFELKVGDRPTLKQFLQFLDTRCATLERSMIPDINITRQGSKTQHLVHFSHNKVQNRQDQASISSNNFHHSAFISFQCLFCRNQNHKIYKCSQFSNLAHSDKIKFVKNQKLCFNCLASQHQLKDCQSKACFLCNKRHHTLLHQDLPSHEPTRSGNFQTQFQLNNSNPRNKSPSQFQSGSQNRFNNAQPPSRFNPSHGSSTEFKPSFEQSCLNRPEGQNLHNSQMSHGSTSSQNSISSSNTVLSTMSKSNEVLLATAAVKLYTVDNQPVYARAILDSCSTTSLVTNDLIEKLGIIPKDSTVNITGIHGTATHSNKIVSLSINSIVKRNFTCDITCCVLEKITDKVPQFRLNKGTISIPKHIELADPDFHVPGQVDILLGADVYYSIVHGIPQLVSNNLLYLVDTHLGYIITGPIPTSSIQLNFNNKNYSCFLAQNMRPVDELIEKFWSIEQVSELTNKALSPEENLAEQIFVDSVKVLGNGRLQVNLPLKTPTEYLKLGNSFNQALNRFLNLEKRFEKNPKLFQDYNEFINEYLSLGHGKYVPLSLQNDNNENKYFIPHHCVIREQSISTKLRVVFDASMKTSSGTSLNDTMLKGFPVQPELYDILCRFRTFPYVLICDIQKMYRQIQINPSQLFLQNILWRSNPNQDIKCIELQTVSYGTNSAPFLATRALKYLADSHKEVYPLAAEAVHTQCYMDDLLCGADSPETLKETHSQLLKLFSSAHFNLHKWCTNYPEFTKNALSQVNQSNYEFTVTNSPNKVLGITWNPVSDNFSISLPKCIDENTPTKRTVLSAIAQLFDPLGFIGPIIVRAKMIMQLIWVSKIDWDSELPSDILVEWNKYVSDIPHLSELNITRYLFSNKELVHLEIHGFADASLKAYGACIYIRAIYNDQTVSCNLFTSKSRVAPLKTISLPRLELCAALLLSKLTEKILATLKNRAFNFHSINLWTDSQITLSWIRSIPSRWSIFVSNRVSEIQQLTADCLWRHVKSADNPADLLSRGLTPQELLKSSLWWHGPKFIQSPSLNLQEFETPISIKHIPEEFFEQRKTLIVRQNNTFQFWEDIFSKFSSFSRLKRSFAFCLRFINNSQKQRDKVTGPLNIEELQNAEALIIKKIQEISFSKELSELKSQKIISGKNILHLSPFLDHTGLLRVGGRLANCDLPFEQKYPILLPSKNRVVSLMLKSEHIRLGHSGAQNVLSNFRMQYWPLGGLKEIKRIIRQCNTCFRFKAITAQQIMADLPSSRVCVTRPFAKVGVDFGGPFLIKSSKMKKAPIIKCYMAIFVCLATKAVHIETVSDLSTESFILCLKRFISRRGNPIIIYSDNATNFLGARNQLRDLYLFFQNNAHLNSITNFLSISQIQWKFIPPRSPHWGGIWEAAVKSTKFHLNRIVGNARLTFEGLSTVLSQIEAILNSRPLIPISSDSQDVNCLTPGHFLIGKSLSSFPEKNVINIPENRLSHWQRLVQMQQQFWQRWLKEYLNSLQNRPKWLKPMKNLQINDVVLLKDENCKPLDWPLARVIEITPSSDGKVRIVKLKTKNGTFSRSITKVCPLPM